MGRAAHFSVSALQYVLPTLLLIGALLASVRRRRETATAETKRVGIPRLHLTWQDFERLVATGFQQRGFRIAERGGNTGATGVEWVLIRGSARFLVECHQERAKHVDVHEVRALYHAMTAEHAAGGFFVTSCTFTKGAQKFARTRNIELIGGEGLIGLLKDGRNRVEKLIFEGIAANGPEMAPFCPACKTPMVVRTAKRGAGAGSAFWACAQSPRCRQTMVMWSERRRSA